VDARLHATHFGPTRSRHGADVWDAAVREGGTLGFEDAIAYALDEPGALTQSETTKRESRGKPAHQLAHSSTLTPVTLTQSQVQPPRRSS